jgi:hypothetical protein
LISEQRRTRASRVTKRGPASTADDVPEQTPPAKRAAGQDPGEAFVSEYEQLRKDFRDLTEGIRMIRRATDRACRGGVLPAVEDGALTPLQECAAIARAIYRAARTSEQQRPPGRRTGMAGQDR